MVEGRSVGLATAIVTESKIKQGDCMSPRKNVQVVRLSKLAVLNLWVTTPLWVE